MTRNESRAAKRSWPRGYIGPEHVPMKKESKTLRRLMSETGLSEQQLRQHKKYRKILSESQVDTPSLPERQLWIRIGDNTMSKREAGEFFRAVRRAMRDTGLTIEHPDTIEAFRQLKVNWGYHWGYTYDSLSDSDIISGYRKLRKLKKNRT